MKTLGTTVEGNFIVEMSPDEHFGFIKLEASVNGKGLFFNRRDYLQGTNLAPIFKALDNLAEAKMSIYQVQEYINFLASVFGGYSKEENKDA